VQGSDAVIDPGGGGHGLGQGGAGEENGELLAAEPAHQIAGAHGEAQRGGHCDQNLVADQMAVGVVDEFEVIEVDHQHGHRGAVVMGPGDGPAGHGPPMGGGGRPGLGIGLGGADEVPVHDAALQEQDGGQSDQIEQR
jgi:hypothetical protein